MSIIFTLGRFKALLECSTGPIIFTLRVGRFEAQLERYSRPARRWLAVRRDGLPGTVFLDVGRFELTLTNLHRVGAAHAAAA